MSFIYDVYHMVLLRKIFHRLNFVKDKSSFFKSICDCCAESIIIELRDYKASIQKLRFFLQTL